MRMKNQFVYLLYCDGGEPDDALLGVYATRRLAVDDRKEIQGEDHFPPTSEFRIEKKLFVTKL